MNGIERACASAAGVLTLCAIAPLAVLSAQQSGAQAAPAAPATTRPAASGQTRPTPEAVSIAGRRASAAAPQGFSVVLVLGDLQGASAADDVPIAARKALNDMREFLPFKSYRLLDAAWLMCCGQQRSSGVSERRLTSDTSTNMASQVLRGPEDQEYELKIYTSRAENARVFVKFTLFGPGARTDVAAEGSTAAMRNARRIADLTDKRAVVQRLLEDTKKRVDVGIAPSADLSKQELELRTLDRELAELKAIAQLSGARSNQRAATMRGASSSIIDTSFTMDVGETVVVGTSRLKGGTKALIALLTAVPPRPGSK